MAKMMTRQGVFSDIPTNSLSITETTLVTPNNHMQSTDENQAKLAHIKDTHTTRTSINPSKFGDTYAMLLGFPDGTPAKVTYYHRNEPGIHTRTIAGELDTSEHPVHADLTKILDFEIRIVSPIEHSINDRNDEFSLSLVAVTYPGFTPIEGDIFYMDIGDGKIGTCEVADVERTSYRHGTYHRIQVNIKQYLDTEDLNNYERRVYDTVHFDKIIYFNANFSFMKHDSFVSLDRLQSKRREMIQWYFNKFYQNDAKTLIRKDGIYDPYVVQFLLKIVSMLDSGKRPTQLYPRVPNYERSIWYLLLETEYVDFTNLLSKYQIRTDTKGLFDTGINYLLNKKFVYLEDSKDSKEQYVLSSEFYNEDSTMTNLETIIYNTRIHKVIDPAQILSQIENYRKLDDLLGFYHIPIYIRLVDMAILTLTNPIT